MRILHFYIKNDERACQYIDRLAGSMLDGIEIQSCDSLKAFRKAIESWKPQIVHLHGAWRLSIARAAKIGMKSGARVVITPHGQLEPWVIKQRHWTEKLPKLLLYQRRCLRKAYCIIAMGRMEAGYMERLGYNTRIETILNSLITETISDGQMGRQMFLAYKKVLDTDTMELMLPQTKTALRGFIKAGITGDSRWLDSEEQQACNAVSDEEWHKIAVFSCDEHINDTIAKGIECIGFTPPEALPQSVDNYHMPAANHAKAVAMGGHESPDDALLSAIKASKRQIKEQGFGICHLIRMAELLTHSIIDEEKVAGELKECGLEQHTSRIMHLLSDMTGLDEGFMILPEKDDRTTRRIKKIITKHVNI